MAETQFTPGPWRWEINLKNRIVHLCGGVPQFDLTVMDFIRWGMSRAQPRFLDPADLGPKSLRPMILDRCEKWAKIVPGREHHAEWFQGIDHPDANLIAAAPDLYKAALAASHALRSYQFGNAATDLARGVADACDAALAKADGGR